MTILSSEIIDLAEECGFVLKENVMYARKDIDWCMYYSDCLEEFYEKAKEHATIKIEGNQLKNLAEFFKHFENSIDNVTSIEVSKEKISINLNII